MRQSREFYIPPSLMRDGDTFTAVGRPLDTVNKSTITGSTATAVDCMFRVHA